MNWMYSYIQSPHLLLSLLEHIATDTVKCYTLNSFSELNLICTSVENWWRSKSRKFHTNYEVCKKNCISHTIIHINAHYDLFKIYGTSWFLCTSIINATQYTHRERDSWQRYADSDTKNCFKYLLICQPNVLNNLCEHMQKLTKLKIVLSWFPFRFIIVIVNVVRVCK